MPSHKTRGDVRVLLERITDEANVALTPVMDFLAWQLGETRGMDFSEVYRIATAWAAHLRG